MANYISKYTGTQIDLSIASGSTPSGLITASKLVLGGASGSVDGITVKGDISASGNFYLNGNIEATQITSSQVTSSVIITEGSNTFGDASTDQHTFNGSISASSNLRVTGDISASGDINLKTGKSIQFAGANATQIKEDSLNLYIDADDDIILRPDDDLVIRAGNTTYSTFFGEGKLRLNSTSTTAPTSQLEVAGGISASGYFSTQGHITASGNISSSGTITAEHFHSSDDALIDDNLRVASRVSIGTETLATNMQLTVDGDISASGTFDLRESASIGVTTTGVGAGTKIPNKGLYVSGSISGSATSTGSFGRVETGKIDIDSITGNWTNAGNTVADLGTITTIDINGGTINGITDLAVADGGTGVSTLTDGGVLLGSGTSGITAMGVLTDGQMIVGDGSTDPVAESGATLRTSIGVGTTDEVKFSKVGISRTTTDEHAKLTVAGDISASGNFLLKEGQFIIWDSGSKGADTHTRDESFIRAINNKIYFGSGSTDNLDYHLTVSMSNGGTSVGVGAPIPPFNYRGLTVEGKISASGDLHTQGNITASAGNFSSHITASGNISSSLTGSFLRINSGDGLFFSPVTYVAPSGDDLYIGSDDDLILQPDDDLVIQAGITTKHTFFAEGRARFNSAASSAPAATVEINGDLKVTTNITASGHISGGSDLFISGNLHLGAGTDAISQDLGSATTVTSNGTKGELRLLTAAAIPTSGSSNEFTFVNSEIGVGDVVLIQNITSGSAGAVAKNSGTGSFITTYGIEAGKCRFLIHAPSGVGAAWAGGISDNAEISCSYRIIK
tara:strand:+ start:2620 stop:5001 length:2382 start_codon:yes stop_codon:yes gene_type:complete